MKLPLLLALSLLPAAPALAQDSKPANTEAEILVVGDREREKERREEIRDFVRALSTEQSDSPLTRFHTACPAVVGLSPPQNLAIASRMRAVAGAAKVPLSEEGCRPNVLVIVVPDKDEMSKLLRKKHPVLFINGDEKPVDVAKENGPATAWHIQLIVDRSGEKIEPSGGVIWVRVGDNGPRTRASFRPLAIGAIVLIEQKGLIGLTTTQIADYAAMRAFTTLHPGRLARTDAPTILRLMDSDVGDVTPRSLTAWDFGFLKGVYEGDPFRYAGTHRGKISGAIIRETKDETAKSGE